MTENEKLRALLAEAQVALQGVAAYDANPDVSWTLTKEDCRDALDRIDAALAEPVAECARCETLRDLADKAAWAQGDAQRRMIEAQKQRDEARAEVERLRSLKPVGTYSLDWNHEQERLRLTAERDAAKAEIDSLRLALEGAENSIKAHQEHEVRLKAELFDFLQDARQRGKTVERERIRRQVEEFARMAPIGPDEMETISEYDSDGWWHADDVLAVVLDEMENKS
jgi:chromosome segregation ATPase